MNAVQRGVEMMNIKMGELPPLAVEFMRHLAKKVGYCGEVCLTAFAVYAQCVEGLECDDDLYEARPEDREWFAGRNERRSHETTQDAGRKYGAYEDLERLVVGWAKNRRIVPNSTPIAQAMKTVSEVGELCDAILKRDDTSIRDGVGDVVVTLVILCELLGIDLTECLSEAYDTIKDRKGVLTPDGVFVKEESP